MWPRKYEIAEIGLRLTAVKLSDPPEPDPIVDQVTRVVKRRLRPPGLWVHYPDTIDPPFRVTTYRMTLTAEDWAAILRAREGALAPYVVEKHPIECMLSDPDEPYCDCDPKWEAMTPNPFPWGPRQEPAPPAGPKQGCLI